MEAYSAWLRRRKAQLFYPWTEQELDSIISFSPEFTEKDGSKYRVDNESVPSLSQTSSTIRSSESDTIDDRSITFCSSRRFPGQE